MLSCWVYLFNPHLLLFLKKKFPHLEFLCSSNFIKIQPDLAVIKTPGQCSGLDLGLDMSMEEANNSFSEMYHND